MMRDFALFDFGKSYFRDRTVTELVIDKLPVSISLGLWTTLLVYAISIPLGVAKAIRHGSRFDVWTSAVVVVGSAVPGSASTVRPCTRSASPTCRPAPGSPTTCSN